MQGKQRKKVGSLYIVVDDTGEDRVNMVVRKIKNGLRKLCFPLSEK